MSNKKAPTTPMSTTTATAAPKPTPAKRARTDDESDSEEEDAICVVLLTTVFEGERNVLTSFVPWDDLPPLVKLRLQAAYGRRDDGRGFDIMEECRESVKDTYDHIPEEDIKAALSDDEDDDEELDWEKVTDRVIGWAAAPRGSVNPRAQKMWVIDTVSYWP